MRLSHERIEGLGKIMARHLLASKMIEWAGKPEGLAAKISEVIREELMVEDRLNAEVKEMMAKYEREIERGNVDYQKMFQMIKKQLVQEREIVL